MHRSGTFIVGVCAVLGVSAQAEPLPLKSGEYTFHHRDAEFPDAPGFAVKVAIAGNRITVSNPRPHGQIPAGVIYRATLMWHRQTRQWILGHRDGDRAAPEVGGCSGGPEVVDFKARVIWTCIGGP